VTDHEGLQELAARYGVEVRWSNAWGDQQDVPPQTLRAVLRAMGVAAENDDQVAGSLRDADQTLWSEGLPPVIVTRESRGPPGVEVRIAADAAANPHRLLIEFESGEQRAVTFVPAALEVISSTMQDDRRCEARRLLLEAAPAGYHRLRLLRGEDTIAESLLVVAPDRGYEPEALRGEGRVWGFAAQLYALRSGRNWGIGDFTDLRMLLELAAARGAGMIGLNPLHALFPQDPSRASPYSPSSRLFLNPLYIDPERIDDFRESEAARAVVGSAEFQTRLAALRDAPLVDYAGVAEVKYRVFESLFANFRERHLGAGTLRAADFEAYKASRGIALERQAKFEALQEHLQAADPGVWGWPVWPQEYRDPDGSAVAELCETLAERIDFFRYLQWQADHQLGAVGARSLELGLGVGLLGDLAVAMDRAGAEAWSSAACLAAAVSIGAPPDPFNPAGQDWGLPAFIPHRLREARYEPFIAVLRAAMRHNGALRIDHVMGLMRLFWVPQGSPPAEGAYVHYPLDDLLGIVALESCRNACLVVGEDLGTVPAEIRTALDRDAVLSCRVLYFERGEDGSCRAPGAYPRRALACVTTHDLPTLAGFWSGQDVLLREGLGQFPTAAHRDRQVVERAEARAQLLLALEREKLLPPAASVNPVSMPQATADFVRNVHRYVARSAACLMSVQLEDVFGSLEQVNLPGVTDDRHPNWRRKLEIPLERFCGDARFPALCAALCEERPPATVARRAGRERRLAGASIPRCTYRLQLNPACGFRQAAALVPYLSRLGVSHVYCSPYLKARAGSTHGYDIIDHNQLNPELGSREDFEGFVAALREHGMGHILDIVPNHVGVLGTNNAWWNDVLENGEASLFADFFDIEWQPAAAVLIDKVLIPILTSSYGEALEQGELSIRFESRRGCFTVCYHDHTLPLNPRSYPRILEGALGPEMGDALSDADRQELQSLAKAFENLPPRRGASASAIRDRHRDKEIHKRRLAELCSTSSACTRHIEAALRALAGRPGEPASFTALHEILEAQPYRLAYWRVASDEINYRRFFDINDLAALRMENAPVFEATHRLVLDLVAGRQLDGVRVDHVDGLFDPRQYFERLQHRVAALLGLPFPADGCAELPLYVVAEKILAPHERLPASWPVHGTTGYDFANSVNGLFIDPGAVRRIGRFWHSFTGLQDKWSDVAVESRRIVLRTALASELTVLANALARIAQAHWHTRDYTLNTLRAALASVMASFPVYRTYTEEAASDSDRRYVDWAVAQAKRRSPAGDQTIFDFVRDALLGEAPGCVRPPLRDQVLAFARKAQQLTGPVNAKGVEDTAFYRYMRFVSLNEVGGDPGTPGGGVRAFHRANGQRAERWPHGMLATSTHDSKRSEDVRARLDVLSEIPGEWRLAVRRWSRLNRSRRVRVDELPAPSRADEYLLYQTLVGTWPVEAPDAAGLAAYRERIDQYMLKAIREAKVRTSWLNPNHAYESAVIQFVATLLGGPDDNLFLDVLQELVLRVARAGCWNSLAQLLCKLTAPGVPDIYQGNELWDFSLVDPDNRRPVDFARRSRLLDALEAASGGGEDSRAVLQSLLANPEDGRCKLFLTWRALQHRAAHEELFRQGRYMPLAAHGSCAGHLCAYARCTATDAAIIVVPRLVTKVLASRTAAPIGAGFWGDTAVRLPARLCARDYVSVLDGRTVPLHRDGRRAWLSVGDVLAEFPVALVAQGINSATP
jgi:(1->4)-alpha-D-glucan 1-alpha-D-glucosylmutase